MKLEPHCENCHPNGWPANFRHGVTGVVLNEMHAEIECAECHLEGVGTPSDCTACHDEGWEYSKEAGFGE